jgi:hypothetical protein
VSEAITTAEEFVYRRREVGMCLDALDEAVELVKACNHEYRVAENGRRQLQQQRDAAVAILKSISVNRGDEHDYAVDALIGIEAALTALGAEETT